MQLATYAVGMAIALLLGQALTLLESAGLGPARLALGQDVHVVFARNLTYPQVRTGLTGVEVDELRRRLEGRAQVLAFRVYEAQVVVGGRKRFATVLGLGREGDAGGAWLFGGVAPQRGVCLAQSGEPKSVLVDEKPCQMETVRWNDAALRFLTGRQRVELVRRLDPREAYLHPENHIYEAVVLGRIPAGALDSFLLARSGTARLGSAAMADWFWEAQGETVLLLVGLGLAVAVAGGMALLGLGIAEGARQKEQDWIRRALGESDWQRWRRQGGTVGVLLVAMAGAVLASEGRGAAFTAMGVAASLSGAWWLGRSLSWTRLVANDLLRAACWAQLATCAGLLCLGGVAQAQYEKAIASRDGWKLDGLSAVPMRVADLESAAARWGPELQQIVARRTGDPQDVGYIWPLPMESGPAIEIERVPGRYYWANWAGLKRLNLGCTDLSAIPEGRLRQGILLSEKLAAAIGSERTGPGRKVRFFDKQLEVLGTCRETGANAYFAAYVFEPANLANVILEEREADALVPGTVSGLWEVDGPAVALAHRWREMWLPEADKAALVDSLGALALGVAFAGLLATALLLVGKCQQEMALRHALGGSGLGLIPGEGWGTLRMVGAANGLVLLLAGLAMAARREWHPAALLACGAAMMLEAARR